MRYAISNMQDGQRPEIRYVPDDYSAQPGEVVREGTPPIGWVWDASTGGMRGRNSAEALFDVKQDKRTALAIAADAEYRNIFTRDGQYIELEKDYIMWRKMFGLALSPLQTNQVGQARAVIEKLQGKLQQVNAATTEAEVETLAW